MQPDTWNPSYLINFFLPKRSKDVAGLQWHTKRHILSKMYAMPSEGRFHAEYDSERSYSKEELAQMFASVEWQADT